MTIQEALQILIDHTGMSTRELHKADGKYWANLRLAAGIAEIMLTEEAFFTAYQEQTVKIELGIQEEERG